MAHLIEKTKKIWRNFRDPWWRAKRKYMKYFDSMAIDDHAILLESQHGKEINGNVFYMIRYMAQSEKYRDFKIYLSVRGAKVKAFRSVLDFYGIRNVNLTVLSSEEYFQILSSAKYLINDNTFLPFFIKKEGQVYLNTWHGTPLKSLGRGIKNDAHAIGNTQKNFVTADYLLFPNAHTRDAIIADYMIANISSGSYLMAGYPRNEAFFDAGRSAQLRDVLELNGKKVYAYMPTFRGTASKGGTSKNSAYLNYYLYELDKRLSDDEVFFVNLHPVAKKDVDFSQFVHIRKFPAEYETYDFLNAAEVLVTDYSSVFFDYACTGRKIVLFTYDKEEYLRDRGMYLSMEDLPFPQAADLDELVEALRSEKDYDDSGFRKQFCGYDNACASEQLCDRVILGRQTGLEEAQIPNNGKENVLMYVGNLSGNGITASIRYLLSSIDLDKRNYYFCFYTSYVGKFRDNIFTFPEKANYFAIAGDPNLTIPDLAFRKAHRMKMLSTNAYMKIMGKRERQNFYRGIGSARFHQVVQFSGYENDTILSFSAFDGPKSIYVHNDMLQEIATRGNQRRDVLQYAYTHYDNVAVVTDDIRQATVEISGREDNICLCKNLIGYKAILEKSQAPIALDPATKTTMHEEQLKELLASDSEIFINVGRFSPEKGHDRLVSAFSTYHKSHPDSYLIIMGGSSRDRGYEKLWQQVKQLDLEAYVVLLENVSNPYPIIRACTYFVLSSLYEGFGLVLVEADILGLPVVSTDITGPKGFMEQHGGTLVESSEAGILEGMELLHSGKIGTLGVDYEQYNREAVAQFEAMMAKHKA